MTEKTNALTAARRRLRAWRDKKAEERAAPHRATQRRMLATLNIHSIAKRANQQGRGAKHVYAGTANANRVAARRRKAKMARKSRRVNRIKAKG
jgi:hypothetical protein